MSETAPAPRRSGSRRWRMVAALAVPAAALAALLLFMVAANLWLGVDALHDVLNRKPEQLNIEWSRASMPWPGRVRVEGLRLRGQDRRLQWYAELDRVALEVDLWALTDRTFRASGIRGEGLRFRMRRRPRSGERPAAVESYPEIPGLELLPAEERPARRARRKRGWRIQLQELALEPVAELWLDQYRLLGAGRVAGDLDLEIHGPLEARGMELVLRDAELSMGGRTAADGLRLDLGLNLAPTPTRGIRPVDLLRALEGAVELDASVSGLGFLHPYLRHARGLEVEGSGDLALQVELEDGTLRRGSRLEVAADSLRVVLPRFEITGSGVVEGRVPAAGGVGTELVIAVEGIELFGPAGGRSALVGPRAEVIVRTPRADFLEGFLDPEILVDLPSLEIPDLSAFNHLLPKRLGLTFVSGSARVRTRLDSDLERGEGELEIVGRGVTVEYGGRRLSGELRVDVRYRRSAEDPRVDLAGTRFRFDGRPLPGGEPWRAELELAEGSVLFDGVESFAQGRSPSRLRGLRLVDERFHLRGGISDLEAISSSLSFGRWLQLSGEAGIEARLALSRSDLAPGSRALVESGRLGAVLADWQILGKGRLEGLLEQDGAAIDLAFRDVEIARRGLAHIRAPDLRLRARGRQLGGVDRLAGMELRLDLGSGQVFDLTAFNDYLPQSGLLSFLGGSGRLEVNAALQESQAEGRFRLSVDEARTLVRGESIVGDLLLDVPLKSDDLLSRSFVVDGGRLRLQGTRRLSEDSDVTRAPREWWGELGLERGRVVLSQPLQVESEVELAISDTRPLLHLLSEKVGAAALLRRWLLFEDVTGRAVVELGPDRLRFSDVDIAGGGVALSGGLTVTGADAGGSRQLEEVELRGEIQDHLGLDFVELNDLFPADGPFAFSGGTGRLGGDLILARGAALGAVDLVGTGLAATVRGEPIETDLLVDVALSTADARSRRFELGGTSLRLDNTRWLADEVAARAPGWWGEVRVVEGEVELAKPLLVDGTVELALRDTRPLVHVMAEKSRVVRWFQSLLEIRDVTGSAELHLSADGMAMRRVRVDGRGLAIDADLDFTGGGEKGAFYVRFHGLSAAVALVDGRRQFQVVRARRWYERQRQQLFPDGTEGPEG